MFSLEKDTICALSTPGGKSAIALIRVSGAACFAIVEKLFSKSLHDKKSHTLHFGQFRFEEQVIDEVVISVFHGPRSYTGEDTAEIACHGSTYIQQQILWALLQSGCRMANPGEFSLRAFANGKMDLIQAEAVADLIDSESKGAHSLAMNQMKGGFSKEIGLLREKLIDFAALIELELDFAEEDVEFADRTALLSLLNENIARIESLIASFSSGNVIKNGVPVAIIGAPNAGKSTLLNALLNEDRAIVSDIPGTTRDAIEDDMYIGNLRFRFIDTAGIRETTDSIESMGIERSLQKAAQARIVLYLIDCTDPQGLNKMLGGIERIEKLERSGPVDLVLVFNKSDEKAAFELSEPLNHRHLHIAAKEGMGISELKQLLQEIMDQSSVQHGAVVVSNARHVRALELALIHLKAVNAGISSGLSGDFLAMDIRQALHHLGAITGQIDNEELLGSIFTRFCIGK